VHTSVGWREDKYAVSSLSVFIALSPPGVAYHLASSDWYYVLTPVHGQSRVLALAHAGAADNLDAAN